MKKNGPIYAMVFNEDPTQDIKYQKDLNITAY